jgi:hypothetical protein
VAGSVSEIPGLRVLYRLGGENLLRFSAVVFWIGILAWVPIVIRSDLIRPADLGSDTSNYVAAAERLVEGHSIYALQPSDRPVPQDNPPEWSGPILSPPTVATTWAAFTWLPDPIAFHLTWAGGLAAATALGLYLVIRLGAMPLILSALALYPLGVVAWSGNINAWTAPALVLVWHLFRRDRTVAIDVVLGALVGIAAAVKLGPVILVWWLITQRRWPAAAAAVMTGIALLIATALVGGTTAFTEYLQLLGSAGAAPSPLSLPGLARQLGLDPIVGYAAIAVLVVVASVAMLVWRNRPGVTFALAVLLSLIVVTIVRVETLVVGIAALAPWATRRPFASSALRLPSLRTGMTALAAVVAGVGVAASVATGGLARSSMALSNGLAEPVVVRFTVPGQYATFGYALPPGQTGEAWTNEMGSVQGRLVVYTTSCRLLYEVPAGRPAIGWRIGAETAAELPEASGGALLAYSSSCARELRALREGPT